MGINSKMTALADAVRAKSGVTGKLSIDGMTAAVNGITTGGGSALDFYKCTAVDTGTKIWTGYKAVLTDGAYVFEESVTTGLSYGDSFTPVVGSIYSEDALVSIRSLWTGVDPSLIFYAPLISDSETAETGQTITKTGNVQYTTFGGKSCAYFDGSSYLYSEETNLPLARSSFTLFAKVAFSYTYDFNHILIFGSHVGFRAWENQFIAYTNVGDPVRDYDITENTFYAAAATYNGTTMTLYLNGKHVTSADVELNTQPGNVVIGCGHGSNYGRGYVADIRIYNRCLSAEEITTLSSE